MLGFSSDMLSLFWQLSKTDVSVLENHFQEGRQARGKQLANVTRLQPPQHGANQWR
jgi:hypothetical protein